MTAITWIANTTPITGLPSFCSHQCLLAFSPIQKSNLKHSVAFSKLFRAIRHSYIKFSALKPAERIEFRKLESVENKCCISTHKQQYLHCPPQVGGIRSTAESLSYYFVSPSIHCPNFSKVLTTWVEQTPRFRCYPSNLWKGMELVYLSLVSLFVGFKMHIKC